MILSDDGIEVQCINKKFDEGYINSFRVVYSH